MRCYFIVDTYIDENKGRGLYDEYIQKVKPIVEGFGGEYLVRSEQITSLHALIVDESTVAPRMNGEDTENFLS